MNRISRVRLLGRVVPVILAAALAAGCTTATDVRDAADGASKDGPSSNEKDSSPRPPATPGNPDPALKSFYTQTLKWGACETDEDTEAQAEGFRCATYKVPLDYTKPEARSIEIAVTRRSAAKPDERIGSLLLNPGGPGSSGVDAAWWMYEDTFGGTVKNRYDIVGFDPRGVERSAPVVCMTDRERDTYYAEDLPDDEQRAQARAEERDKEFAEGCQARSGELLPHVGTGNAARDMDILRAVLGDEKLNYVGFSYGTYLGSIYAEQFPGRTGRIVLDGAVDPAADTLSAGIDQQIGFEKSLRNFAADCARRAACPLGSDPSTAAVKVADFLDGLQDRPLPAGEGRRLTSSLGWTGVIRLLYGDEEVGWRYLRESLTLAMVQGRGEALLFYADNYNGRGEDGKYDNSQEAFIAISCADETGQAPTPEQVRAAYDKFRAQAPLFSRDTTVEDLDGASCEGWPARSGTAPHEIQASGAAPILVIGTTGDPATPYAAAEKLAGQLTGSALLTFEGEGHTAYGGNSTCIDDAVEAYLIDAKMPAKGTRCK